MRFCCKVIGSFLICFLGLVVQKNDAEGKPNPCDWSKLINNLKNGTPPTGGDAPQPRACNDKAQYDPSLADAAAAFINAGKIEPAKLASVLELIRGAHKAQIWQTNYWMFAETLEGKVNKSTYKEKISEGRARATKPAYDVLNPLIELMKISQPIPQPPPKGCAKNIALLEGLRSGAIPVEFVFDKECPPDLKMANALLPLIKLDLRDKTSRTASLITEVHRSLLDPGHESELTSFSNTLREELGKSGDLKGEIMAPGGDFLDHLLHRIQHHSYPIPRQLAIWIVVSWLLTLANAALIIYLFYYHLKPTPSPLPVPALNPQVIGLAKSLESLSSLHNKAEESISALERRLCALEAAPPSDLVDLKERFGKIEGAHQEVQRQLSQWNASLSEANNKSSAPQALSEPEQEKLSRSVDVLNRHVNAIYKMIGKPPEGSKTTGSNINLEREILNESWKKFNKDKELTASIDRASKDDQWLEIRDPLLFQLPQAVPEDLRATFDAILAPARDYHNLTSKIALVPRLVSGDLPKLESEAQELTRIREFTHLLAMTLNSNLVADRLNFHLERWITDQFLSFADLFLQRFQQAQMEGKDASLEPGLRIVRQVLGVANLAPIELVLGETVFDSTKHIGRSTTSDTLFPDGVVMAAVRNGFMQGGQQVLRQPEVIVNRVR